MNLANLEQAVFTRLAGFTALTSQLSGQGIYARKPQDDQAESTTPFPYITFSLPSSLPWDTDDIAGAEVILRVHVWSRSQSRLEIARIMDSVYDCLHRFDLVIAAANTVDCLYVNQETMDDPDGVTMHGIVDFRITYDGI